jgi:hypothetical protein
LSLYREPGQARRRRRTLVLGGVAVAVLIVVAVVLIASGGGSESAADRAKRSQDAVAKSLDGLELLRIEYAQAVDAGRVVEPTEYQAAQADVKRAQDSLADADRSADPAAYARASAALAAVARAVERRVDAARLEALVASARSAIEPLAG